MRFGKTRLAAAGLAAGAFAVSVTGIVLALMIPGYFATFVNEFLMVSAVCGVAYPVIGGWVAWRIPRNPIGWLFILQGWCGGALPAIGEPYGLVDLRMHHLPLAAWVAWIGGWSWVLGVLLGPTVVLTLWPSGRAPGRLRLLVFVSAVVVAASTVVFAVSPVAMDADVQSLGQPVDWRSALALLPVVEAVVLVCVIACLTAAVRRLLQARSPEREQLGWYLVIAFVSFACSALVPPLTNAAIQALLILALGWALLRYGLVDLRLALRRALVYAALTVCVAAVYALVTGVLSAHVPAGPLPALVAAALVAVGLIPFRDVMQRAAERLVYGGQRDPAQAVARVGERLQRPGGLLPAAAEAIADALRSPYVAIEDVGGHLLAAHGDPGAGPVRHMQTVDHQGHCQGRLVIVPRTRGEPLDKADLRVLNALTPHVGLAVRAAALTAELASSRGQVIAAARAERERLRRDLHDGMGPSLSGLALGLQAAQSLLKSDLAATSKILLRTRAEPDRAVTEIRRIIEDLRPDALDQFGLVGALRTYSQLVSTRGLLTVDVSVQGFDDQGTALLIDPHVEVAAYRITHEALTNVVRHSGASHCTVGLSFHDALHIQIRDNGRGIPAGRPYGVGLSSIRRRAESCGGTLAISTSATGTCLTVRLPPGPAS